MQKKISYVCWIAARLRDETEAGHHSAADPLKIVHLPLLLVELPHMEAGDGLSGSRQAMIQEVQ